MNPNGIMEDQYTELAVWYAQHFSEETIISSSGCTLRLAYKQQPGTKGVVLIVNGRIEYIEKYLELLKDLQELGLSTWIYDHCGQGGSERILEDRQKGHIESFSTYVNDLGIVVDLVNQKNRAVPVFIVSHSMGGTISTLYCAKNPGKVKRLILESPMFSIRTGTVIPQCIIRFIAMVFKRFGGGARYMPTTGPFNPDQNFAGNPLTSDKNRFEFNLNLMTHLKQVTMGGPTYSWLYEAYKAMDQAQKTAKHISCPVLFLTGSDDSVVKLKAIRAFSSLCPNYHYKEYVGARHELYMERDQIRDQVLAETKEFLKPS